MRYVYNKMIVLIVKTKLFKVKINCKISCNILGERLTVILTVIFASFITKNELNKVIVKKLNKMLSQWTLIKCEQYVYAYRG